MGIATQPTLTVTLESFCCIHRTYTITRKKETKGKETPKHQAVKNKMNSKILIATMLCLAIVASQCEAAGTRHLLQDLASQLLGGAQGATTGILSSYACPQGTS